jgi:hypothetical protein
MQLASSDPVANRRKKILTGDLALTNITVAEVIWHHGGGIPVELCSGDHATCWSSWWQRYAATFSGLDLNGRWLSTVNRFSSAPTISLADPESLPSSRLTFCWAQVFHVGCDRPNNRNRSLTSPSGHPRTGPVLALRPSNLP